MHMVLAVERPWSALAGPVLSFLTQWVCRPLSCKGSISGIICSFQLGRTFAGQ